MSSAPEAPPGASPVKRQPTGFRAWIAPVGYVWSLVAMALPAMATAWFFSDVALHALNDFVIGGVCFGIVAGFLFGVSGMSVWSARAARLKVAASLLGLFFGMFVVLGYLLHNPLWSFWGYLLFVCSALTAGLFTAFIIFLKPTPA